MFVTRKIKIVGCLVVGIGLLILCLFLYGLAQPPQHDHSHCIVIANSILDRYDLEHGHYPYSSNGYGDAILRVTTNRKDFQFFTAAGYDTKVFEYALEHTSHVPETECDRVYVQVPGTNRDPNIVMLFDKKSRRGGREVDRAGFVRDADWPAFVKQQIDLLVARAFHESRRRTISTKKSDMNQAPNQGAAAPPRWAVGWFARISTRWLQSPGVSGGAR